MKRFISIILSLITILSLCISCQDLIPIAAAYSVPYNEAGYTYDDLDTLIELIEEQISNMEAAHQMAEAARQLGYSENHEVIKLAREEYIKADNVRQEYQNVYDNLVEHWHQKEEEYPVATYIWSYLKDLGYTDQVCAGILGNIMTEVGGNMLDIQWWLISNTYYGMCQWSKTYYPEVVGASLEEQCDFLRDTIENELDTFGSGYSTFLESSDVTDAALTFAKGYERCGVGTYRLRQENAIAAYNYFIG